MIFSRSEGCLFTLLIVLFVVQKLFKYVKYIHVTIITTIHHQNFCQVSKKKYIYTFFQILSITGYYKILNI